MLIIGLFDRDKYHLVQPAITESDLQWLREIAGQDADLSEYGALRKARIVSALEQLLKDCV